jgi:precorrin-3B C17-methyltransferase
MTLKAVKVLEMSDIIVGYTVYIDLIKTYFPGKEFLSTPMKQEVERCILAFEEAEKGKTVSVICSGDAGVYGMSGLMLELSEHHADTSVEIIPGVTAALSGGALLGAPLMHDFAVISLSDLLTPWEKIEKRLILAAQADLVICLYNPSSRKRFDYLQKACDIILEYADEGTICGIAGNIGRNGEEMKTMSLKELRDAKVDMFATVFIGNSQTKIVGGRIVTPRGYKIQT